MKLFPQNAVIKYKNAEKYQIGNVGYNASGLIQIDVDWLCGSIEIVTAAESNGQFASSEILIEENGTAALSEAKKLRTLFENGVLKIRFCESGYKGNVSHGEKKLKITLIAVKTLSEININSASAPILLSELSVQKVKIKTASGSAKIENCTMQNLSVKTASGTAHISNASGSTADIETASGNVEIFGFALSNTRIQTASGNIDLELGNTEQPQNGARVTFVTASGKLNAKSNYILENGAYLYGNGARSIGIETASGSLTVN